MATCKYCGKSGIFHQTTKNGLCPNCETFIIHDLQNRSRIFNESKEILYKSENPDVVFSRLNVAKDILAPMIIYEHKGIGIYKPQPSQLLKDLEEEQNSIIYGCFERAFKTLNIKLMNLKSPTAVANNVNKFVQKIDEYLPKTKDPTQLIQLRNKALALTAIQENKIKPVVEINRSKTTANIELPVRNSIQIKEIHPAKLLYEEQKTPDDLNVQGGIQISLTINDDGRVEIIGPMEPSTIYKDLPVVKPREPSSIKSPPYYPSYIQLIPEQRWIYLNWLTDISRPVDIGYVFLYYYGLERQLVIGDFETAVQEILLLRHIHENKSFESYSYNGLLYGSALKNRPDLIQMILDNESRNGIDNADLLFKYRFEISVSAKELMTLAKKYKGTNLRYIKAVPDLYVAALSTVLEEKFGAPELPISTQFDISDIPQIQAPVFANISFPSNLRTPKLPDIIKYEPFAQACIGYFDSAHRLVKEDLIRERLIRVD